jgi:hypothetical protein
MKLVKDGQSGQALIMALILLALSSLIVIPILNLAGTSLNYHRVIQRNTLETYAADSGVDYALCQLGNDSADYEVNPLQDNFTLNDKTVNVTAEYQGNDIFKITSTATTDSNSSTTIESYVDISLYPAFFNNGITSRGDVTIRPGAEVNGDVQYNGTLDNKGTIDGTIIKAPVDNWPTVDELSQFYWVDDVISGSSIDISSGTEQNPYLIGPGHTSGNLKITGSGVAALSGTLYVQGSLTLQPGTSIKLSSETIYADVDITIPSNTNLYGPGCVIAAGDVNFQPNLMTAEEAYILVMSIEGEVQFQPGNDFYGSLAGNIEVTLQPGCGLYAAEPDPGLEYPLCTTLTTISYNIN